MQLKRLLYAGLASVTLSAPALATYVVFDFAEMSNAYVDEDETLTFTPGGGDILVNDLIPGLYANDHFDGFHGQADNVTPTGITLNSLLHIPELRGILGSVIRPASDLDAPLTVNRVGNDSPGEQDQHDGFGIGVPEGNLPADIRTALEDATNDEIGPLEQLHIDFAGFDRPVDLELVGLAFSDLFDKRIVIPRIFRPPLVIDEDVERGRVEVNDLIIDFTADDGGSVISPGPETFTDASNGFVNEYPGNGQWWLTLEDPITLFDDDSGTGGTLTFSIHQSLFSDFSLLGIAFKVPEPDTMMPMMFGAQTVGIQSMPPDPNLIQLAQAFGSVPEPTSLLLFGSGMIGLLGWRRRNS